MFDSRAREFLRTVSRISSDNYPETLGAMFIVNVPSFFSILYNVAKPLIPPETKRKIHVLTAKNVKAELLKFIDAEQLPSFLGGNCVCDTASTTDDKGCLSSNVGPWKDVMAENADKDEFVSCAGDLGDPRAFSIEHFHTPNISRLPSSMAGIQQKKRWSLFSCCSKKSIN
jgi:hypothetical protein